MVDLEEWSNGASDAKLMEMLSKAKARRNIYFLLTVLLIWTGIGSIIFAGLTIFAINNVNIIKQRETGGLIWWLLFLAGLIIFPIIVTQLCSKIHNLGMWVLGWNKLKIQE